MSWNYNDGFKDGYTAGWMATDDSTGGSAGPSDWRIFGWILLVFGIIMIVSSIAG